MNKVIRVLILACFAISFASLIETPAQVQTTPEGLAKNWIVPGLRHGPSFFARNSLKETTPLQEGVLDFKHYHKYTEQVEYFKKWEKQ